MVQSLSRRRIAGLVARLRVKTIEVTYDASRRFEGRLRVSRSMECVIRYPSLPLERRRQILRSLLPIRDGSRPPRE